MYLTVYFLLSLALTAHVIGHPDGPRPRGHVRSPRRALKRARTTPATPSDADESSSRAPFVPREIIKFELADAKIPDFQPQYQQKKQTPSQKPKQTRRVRQRRPKPTNSPTVVDHDKPEARDLPDTAGAASRIMQISHPPPSVYDSTVPRQRGVKELPFNVQKAINHALKQDFNIPYLDTIKYYIKDPAQSAVKTSFTENRLKNWWQLPSSLKASPSPSPAPVPTSYSYSTTQKTISSAEQQVTDYAASYPLLRAYPVQYSTNVGSDLVGGVSFLYGDRIYTKVPYAYGKAVDTSNAVLTELNVKSAETPTLADEYITVTPNSLSSTSPVQFPPSPKTVRPRPTKPSIVKYYAAVPADEGGAPLSTDKNTLNLISKAVNAIKKHNPHLDVVPKRVENDELIVHVTPKPDYFKASDATKTLTSTKNLAYLTQKFVENEKLLSQPVLNKQKITKVVNHHYLKQLQAAANGDNGDLFESGYAFGYRVRDHSTGNDFGHHQKRMVDGTTHGQYKILMPDGRTQNVKYKADDHGYHADVSYEE